MHIPHLKTTQMVQSDIEKCIISQHINIESWFREQWQAHTPLITCSVDIRNAAFKIAPVDTNVFPAGFNNLNPDFNPLCVQAMLATLSHAYPGCKRIGIIPESHTRNPFYLQSLLTLFKIVEQAGFEVIIGTFRDIDAPETFPLENDILVMHPIVRDANELTIGGQRPCLILLNHDLSDGIPKVLKDIKQPVIPNPVMGWSTRSKIEHFKQYAQVAEVFCTKFGLDPWLLNALYTEYEQVDFSSKDIDDRLVNKTYQLLEQIQDKYDQHQIKEKPFVVIKSDSGTYGMAVMVVTSADELKALNRKQRSKMNISKGGETVTKVIIQEGVHTVETIGSEKASAEPVVYMIGEFVIGGFYRVHTRRGPRENLNAPGMHFEPLAFDSCCHTPDARISPHDEKNQFYVYSVIARLAHLACLHEVYE